MTSSLLISPTEVDTWPGSGTRDLEPRVGVEHLPAMFARYQDEPEQMRAGAPGKIGLLELSFETDGARTRLASGFASGPQRVQRALYLDPTLRGMAFALIQSVSGGILQGDRLAIEITASAGAQAHITTQSATKLYRMERNFATQRVRLRVDDGAYVEYLPDYLIPYQGARFYQEVDLHVAGGGTLLYSDAVAPGRSAAGEAFEYDLLYTRVQGYDDAGALRLLDTLVLEPGRTQPQRPGVLGGHTDVGTLYVLTRRVEPADLAARLHASVQGVPAADAAASELPGGNGAVVRAVADSTRALQVALYRAWREARLAITGTDVPRVSTAKYGQEPDQSSEKESEP